MFNKKSNKTLLIIFAILLIAVILIFNTESTKKERSFRKSLVEIDTNAITSISIFPKSKPGSEVKLLKENDVWKVSDEQFRSYSVPNSKINNLFNELSRIKPKRVAARSKSKWTEYQVDSAATRVVAYESGSEVLNLIIGKFAFQQPRSMSTFVRLMGENDVYEVDGFLDMTFNKDLKSFRNETIIKSDKNNWNKLSFFSGPAKSFELVKLNESWTIDGTLTDSAKTENALNTLARLSNADFIDKADENILPSESSKLIIERIDGVQITVTGYRNNESYLVHSSQNLESYFDGNKVGEKIFISKESLF